MQQMQDMIFVRNFILLGSQFDSEEYNGCFFVLGDYSGDGKIDVSLPLYICTQRALKCFALDLFRLRHIHLRNSRPNCITSLLRLNMSLSLKSKD